MSQTPQDRLPDAQPTWPDQAAPQGYAGQPGTPMPAYAHPELPVSGNTAAMAAFILGIFSVVGFPFLGPVAWILARRALRDIDRADRSGASNRGLAVAAKVLGIIGTVFLVLVVIGLVVVVVVVLVSADRNMTPPPR
ncbi:MAG: DUF4190 domain-containing protein [Lapillicoccus sp.]